ncbi:hypothetical protein F5Y17DRAFT_73667 [Xylariaceae sp. FL0594]|nr:hypothetical protein F5Y17DRAFT_73667 [Xylariaceae sp. FL0594]
MTAFLELSKNYSFYTLPLAWLLTMLPTSYAKSLGGKNYDVAYPRDFVGHVKKDESLDKATKGKILRAEAAAANGSETIGLFVGAVLAANYAGVPVETINTLSIGYLLSRAAFNYTYIFLQDNRKFAPVRSLIWISGLACWVTLYVKAGNRL